MSFRIYHSDDNYLVQLPLPGIQPDNLEVFIERDDLVIRAKRLLPEGNLLVGEFPTPNIERRLRLDTNSVDAHSIEARYEQGLLTLTLAKRAKRIEIKVA